MIKVGAELFIDTYFCHRFADADLPKPPDECEHVSEGKAGDGVTKFMLMTRMGGE